METVEKKIKDITFDEIDVKDDNILIKPKFESIGFYVPEKIVTTQELINQMQHKPMFDLERLTGIKERRFRSESESSFTMALAAAQNCLKNSQYEAKDLDVIIFTSITRYKNYPEWEFEPTISLHLKKELGATTAINFDVSNACAGMLTGAYILHDMIIAGTVKKGMVVSGECITPLTETAVKEITEPIDEQFASLTVGDSGAAFILDISQAQDEGIDFIEFMTNAKFADLCYAMPSNKNPGAAMYTKARKIHKEAIKRIPNAIHHAYNKFGKPFKSENYDFVIGHQTSERAILQGIDVVVEHFKETTPEVLFSLHEYGNTSTTTHFAVLQKGLRENKVKKGSRIIFMSIASGLVFGYVSATIGDLKV